MSYAIGGYVAAMVATQALPVLPSARALCVVVALACAMALVASLRWTIGVALGVVVATAFARDALEHRAGTCADGRSIELSGVVAGLPRVRTEQTQFDFDVDAAVDWPPCAGSLPRRMRVSWFGGPSIEPDERWQLRVKWRGVRGYQNPGGFDYEGFALANRIDGGGQVEFGRRLSAAPEIGWDRLRFAIRERFEALGLRQPGILLAMVTGDAGLMDERDWALFRATGTVHLMVISGLHLTMVGAVGIALGRGLARLRPRDLARRGAAVAGVASGVVCVTLYACLAGWGVAVLRAWIATIAVAALVALSRRSALPTSFVSVAAVVLTFDPLAPLQAGFWLSLVAVAVLLAFFTPRTRRGSALRSLVLAQIVMAVAMTPALLGTIGSVAWIGPIANLVAVPVLSIVVVPIDLVAALTLAAFGVGADMLRIADVLTDWTVVYLRALASFGWVGWQTDASPFAVWVSIGACLALLLPLPMRHRALLLPCAFVPLLPGAPPADDGHFRVSVFDVGQGLAVAIETSRHRLLYDAGPRYRSGFDLGRIVVVPALSSVSSDRLDAAALSHADMDHVGGFAAVADAFGYRALIGGDAVVGRVDLRPCVTGQGWQWDGVRFRVFRSPTAHNDNDRSCVLSIDDGASTVLLAGDVSWRSESALLDWLGGRRIDVLVAAHHGSRTSSSAAFVRETEPQTVIFSAGYLNRFGHPHPDVVCRFRASGARSFATAYSGALVWSSERPGTIVELRRYAPPYWRVGARSEHEWQACGDAR